MPKGFQKGDKWNGNPNGRPPTGKAIGEAVRARLEEVVTKSKKTYLDTLIDEWLFQGTDGENVQLKIHSQKMLIEYAYGRPVQRIEGADGGPVAIELVNLESLRKRREDLRSVCKQQLKKKRTAKKK